MKKPGDMTHKKQLHRNLLITTFFEKKCPIRVLCLISWVTVKQNYNISIFKSTILFCRQ